MPTISLETIFSEANAQGASDIHLAVDKPPMVRIHGELRAFDAPIITSKKIEELVGSLLLPSQREKFLRERELDISYQTKDGSRFRINLHFEKDHMGMVARIIPLNIPDLEDIGMPKGVYPLLSLDYGLVLVTGPTGCGKSTSLAAMINFIATQKPLHVVTLEDPIEFLFHSDKSIIKQRQLGTDMSSFAEGLKHTLRQDPNVIMVGEMRDLETIATTLTLAETGHLVLATLHTNNAAQTIDRIIDVFPPHQQNQIRMQVSSSLKAVISQRLMPRVGGGRVAAREILINNPAVANLIRENKIAQMKSIIQTGANEGMITIDQHIKRLLEDGIISQETALAHISSPQELK